jgi:hypothetical protein
MLTACRQDVALRWQHRVDPDPGLCQQGDHVGDGHSAGQGDAERVPVGHPHAGRDEGAENRATLFGVWCM